MRESYRSIPDDELRETRRLLVAEAGLAEDLLNRIRSSEVVPFDISPNEVRKILNSTKSRLGLVDDELARRESEGITIGDPTKVSSDEENVIKQFKYYISSLKISELEDLRADIFREITSAKEMLQSEEWGSLAANEVEIRKDRLSFAITRLNQSLEIIDEEIKRRNRPRPKLIKG